MSDLMKWSCNGCGEDRCDFCPGNGCEDCIEMVRCEECGSHECINCVDHAWSTCSLCESHICNECTLESHDCQNQ